MRTGKASYFILLIYIITFAVPAFAAEAGAEKLGEGVEEAATGWTEVPKQMAETTEETNPIEGLTVGTIKGAGDAVVKTTEGTIKAATFYIPDKEEAEEE
jgi:putative exosortase-associated protein (TIGR04073 family)